MSSSDRDNDPKPGSTVDSGRRHEQLAAEFLVARGFEILERNWRAGRLEIDLIAHRPGLVAFVEVKSSRTSEFGHPAEKVDATKIQNLANAANAYLAGHSFRDCDFRFDVIAFLGGKLEYFPGAFTIDQ